MNNNYALEAIKEANRWMEHHYETEEIDSEWIRDHFWSEKYGCLDDRDLWACVKLIHDNQDEFNKAWKKRNLMTFENIIKTSIKML